MRLGATALARRVQLRLAARQAAGGGRAGGLRGTVGAAQPLCGAAADRLALPAGRARTLAVRAACAERCNCVKPGRHAWCRLYGQAQMLLCACMRIHEAVGMMG